jgi:hypothetical protein
VTKVERESNLVIICRNRARRVVVWKEGNPFISREEGRRFGVAFIQLYFPLEQPARLIKMSSAELVICGPCVSFSYSKLSSVTILLPSINH